MAEFTIRRHQPIFDPAQHPHPIHIIGCGATGSRVFTALVELGCTNIHCYDFDTVEEHNLANQAYTAEQIGIPKVDACAALYKSKTGAEPHKNMSFHNLRLPDNSLPYLEGYIFLLTDTMESRREIYDKCIYGNPLIDGVIETRMASTHGNVLFFNPQDAEKSKAWLATLIDDGEAELSPCGQPMSVGTTASIIANLAVMQYMWAVSDPAAVTSKLDIYLKPFMSCEGTL